MSLILPKHAKTREPKDEHCVKSASNKYSTCDAIPLDNSSNIAQIS